VKLPTEQRVKMRRKTESLILDTNIETNPRKDFESLSSILDLTE
jgi:hypothetical protein